MLTSARRAISYPNTDRSDRPDVPAHILNLVNALEQDVLFNIGPDSGRIAAAHQVGGGRIWWANDTGILWFDDGTAWQAIGNAPLNSPAFTGTPTAPTAPAATNTTQIATTAYVKSQNFVSSVFGRGGVVTAQTGDYTVAQVTGAAPLASPTFTGAVNAPTPATADNSTLVATTAWVKSQGFLTAATVVVTSFNTRSGAVVPATGDYTVAQVTGAAPLASPAFTGVPTAPTPATVDNSTKLATTAWVIAQGFVTAATVGGVSSFNTRVGAVMPASGDYTVAQVTGAAPLASPALTGTPTAPTPAIGDNSAAIATTAFVRSIMPAGVVVPYVGTAAPAGWLMCSGQAVSRTTYAALFAIIGSAYGGGDGTTTFNVPNLQGRIPVGQDTGTFATLGATGGEQTHVLSAAEMPTHTHTFTGTAMAGHSHTFTGTAMGTHTHNFTGTALGTHTHVFTGAALPTHNHNFTGTAMAGHTHAFSGSALAAHTHTFAGATVPDHHHAMTMNHTPTSGDIQATFAAHARDGGTIAIIDIGALMGATGVSSNAASWTGMVDFTDSTAGNVSGTNSSVSAGTPAGTNSSVSAGTPAGSIDSQSAGTPAGTNAAVSAGTPAGTLDNQSAGTPAGTLSTDSAGTPAGTNANTGGGTAHNNLQPYIVTNYIIKT